jgi:hypothetical protein
LATPVEALVRPGPRWLSTTEVFFGAGITVGRVGGDLFMAGVDELDAAFFQRVSTAMLV